MTQAEQVAQEEGLDVDDETLEKILSSSEAIQSGVQTVKRAITGQDEEVDLLEQAEELWDVLDEVEDILDTVDLSELPEAINVEELPDLIDLEDIPEGLLDEDESVIDLTHLHEAINLRELWEAVDLSDLREEKQELSDAMAEATDEDSMLGDEDDDEDEMFQNVVATEGAYTGFEGQERQAVLEEKILAAVEKFREVVLATHEKLRKLYHANQEKLGQPGRQPDSLNPTAVSTLPPGPVPDSASTRRSTVPAQVKFARVDNPRRIYGRRFMQATDRDTEAESDESGSPTKKQDEPSASAPQPDEGEGDQTEGPRITVYQSDE